MWFGCVRNCTSHNNESNAPFTGPVFRKSRKIRMGSIVTFGRSLWSPNTQQYILLVLSATMTGFECEFWQGAHFPSFQFKGPQLNVLVIHNTRPCRPTFISGETLLDITISKLLAFLLSPWAWSYIYSNSGETHVGHQGSIGKWSGHMEHACRRQKLRRCHIVYDNSSI